MRVDMFPEYMLSVRATVESGRETEFNRWYDEEHVPDAVRMLPGCIGAARYKVVLGDGSHQYMALYAFESAAKLADALSGPEIRELIKIYDRDIGAFSTRVRTTYERVLLHAKTS
jgi:antibiotic biosynthesis monooxygenase (ABM) superfamily enzyme